MLVKELEVIKSINANKVIFKLITLNSHSKIARMNNFIFHFDQFDV